MNMFIRLGEGFVILEVRETSLFLGCSAGCFPKVYSATLFQTTFIYHNKRCKGASSLRSATCDDHLSPAKMAEGAIVKVDDLKIQSITLGKILDAFNGPLNEEQAWALCHQSAKFLEQSLSGDGDKGKDFNLDGIDSVSMRKDGSVTFEEQEVAGDSTGELP